jgi:hypothetical protein
MILSLQPVQYSLGSLLHKLVFSCDCLTELHGYRCDCGSTQYYKDSLECQTPFSHGGGCSGTHMCMPNLNLICSSSVCTCIDDYYWTGSICSMFPIYSFIYLLDIVWMIFDKILIAPQKSINQPCTLDDHCINFLKLYFAGGLCK